MKRRWVRAHRGGMLALLTLLNRLPIGNTYHRRLGAASKERSLMALFELVWMFSLNTTTSG